MGLEKWAESKAAMSAKRILQNPGRWRSRPRTDRTKLIGESAPLLLAINTHYQQNSPKCGLFLN